MRKESTLYKTTNLNASKGGAQIRATVLVDNEAQVLCESEWGLSILIELAYTGHCTGERAFKILQEELGEDVIKATKSGLRIELDDRIEQA